MRAVHIAPPADVAARMLWDHGTNRARAFTAPIAGHRRTGPRHAGRLGGFEACLAVGLFEEGLQPAPAQRSIGRRQIRLGEEAPVDMTAAL